MSGDNLSVVSKNQERANRKWKARIMTLEKKKQQQKTARNQRKTELNFLFEFPCELIVFK